MQPALNFKVMRLARILFEFKIPDLDQFFVLLFNDLGFDALIMELSE